jgi:hypothetical protein
MRLRSDWGGAVFKPENNGGGGGTPSAMPIPMLNSKGKTYKTWSLFLASGPKWGDGSAEMIRLYEQFTRFGKAIGPGDLAVWFTEPSVKPTDAKPETMVTNYDHDRAAEFCKHYGLKPSKSPHILVTTTYPDLSDKREYATISLGRSNVETSLRLLTELNDQIFAEKISQKRIRGLCGA